MLVVSRSIYLVRIAVASVLVDHHLPITYQCCIADLFRILQTGVVIVGGYDNLPSGHSMHVMTRWLLAIST